MKHYAKKQPKRHSYTAAHEKTKAHISAAHASVADANSYQAEQPYERTSMQSDVVHTVGKHAAVSYSNNPKKTLHKPKKLLHKPQRHFHLLAKRHRKQHRTIAPMDLPFLLLVLCLVGFGLVMLYSASHAVALYRMDDAYAYIRPQLLFAGIGLCAMGVASRVDYHVFHRLAWPLMAVSVALLIVVLFMPEYNGCKRWIVLPGLGTLQPSEIAKFAIVLTFSQIISVNYAKMKTFSYGVLPFLLLLSVVAVLMLLEPHLSGTLVILGIGAVLMFVGGTGLKWFAMAAVGGAFALAAVVVLLPDLVPYAMDRLSSWIDPFADPLGAGHQTIQSLYAIGSGGATGLGLGNSRQKHLYVPEPQNDFIFAIICEELGFVGAMLVVLLFVFLLLRGVTIAVRAADKFGALLTVGFIIQVTLQAALNIAVVTNTIPNTGISLPFFSSGGTSLMMLLGEMGIILSVSRGGLQT